MNSLRALYFVFRAVDLSATRQRGVGICLMKFTGRGRYSTRLFSMAGMAALLLAGCGDSSTDEPGLQGATGAEPHGIQTLIIHIPDMGERLELM